IDPPAAGTINSGQGTNSINVTWTSAGPATVKLHVCDAQVVTCCGDCSLPVTVTNKPTCDITGPTSPCINTAQDYSTTATGGRYAWLIDPPAAGTINSGQGTNSVNVTWSANGTLKLHIVSVDNADCACDCSLAVTPQPCGGCCWLTMGGF